jgi:hypothetical protein
MVLAPPRNMKGMAISIALLWVDERNGSAGFGWWMGPQARLSTDFGPSFRVKGIYRGFSLASAEKQFYLKSFDIKL